MNPEPMCENCGIAIRWQATIVNGRVYCCPGCSQGGPCECDYDNLPQADRAAAMIVRQTEEGQVANSG